MSNQTETVEGVQNPSQSISFEELIAQRTAKHAEALQAIQQPPEDEETEQEPTAEETDAEETESEETESEDVETDDEDAEQEETEIDLLSLTTEQIQQLAKKGKSRLLKDIGKLRAENRALAEKLNASAEAKPFKPTVSPEDNPFKDIQSVQELQAKYQELEKVAEDTDRILEDYEGYAADDTIEIGGKEFAKKDVRAANRNAKKALMKYLPAQAAEIQRIEQLKELEARFNEAIPKEIPEVAEEGSEAAKLYSSMIADPLVDQVRQRVPDLAPQLGFLLAHAAASISRKSKPKPIAKAAGITAQVKVPAVPFSAAADAGGGRTAKKKAEDAYKRFQETGSEADWIAARIAMKS